MCKNQPPFFSCQSLLLSTSVLNDIQCTFLSTYVAYWCGSKLLLKFNSLHYARYVYLNVQNKICTLIKLPLSAVSLVHSLPGRGKNQDD